MPGWFFWALVQVGLTLVQRGLATFNVIRQRASPFQAPTSDEGRFIPIAYGQFAISPNIVIADVGVPDPRAAIPDYTANMVMTVCHGVVDEISDIIFGGLSLRGAPAHQAGIDGSSGQALVVPAFPYVRPGSADTQATFDIQGRKWFGGETREGGVAGEMRLSWGGLNQPADQLTVAAYASRPGITGGAAPGKPTLCCVAFGTAVTNFWRLP